MARQKIIEETSAIDAPVSFAINGANAAAETAKNSNFN